MLVKFNVLISGWNFRNVDQGRIYILNSIHELYFVPKTKKHLGICYCISITINFHPSKFVSHTENYSLLHISALLKILIKTNYNQTKYIMIK